MKNEEIDQKVTCLVNKSIKEHIKLIRNTSEKVADDLGAQAAVHYLASINAALFFKFLDASYHTFHLLAGDDLVELKNFDQIFSTDLFRRLAEAKDKYINKAKK